MAPRTIVDPRANARCVIGSSTRRGRGLASAGLLSQVVVRHTSLRAASPMMSVPLRPRRREGGCPITTAVRRPGPKTSSPPHDIATQDGPVLDVVFPDVIDDLGQAAGQRHPGNLLALAVLHGAEPGAQGTGPARGLGGGQHERP